jgi:hypothetical protein
VFQPRVAFFVHNCRENVFYPIQDDLLTEEITSVRGFLSILNCSRHYEAWFTLGCVGLATVGSFWEHGSDQC